MKKIISILLIIVAILCVTWFYKLVFLSFIILMWRKELIAKLRYPHAGKILAGVMILLIFWSMPRYRTNSNDRIQLIYQNSDGKATTPPLYQYIANTILPEEEVMNWGLKVAGFSPSWFPWPVGKSLVEQFQDEYEQCGNSSFIDPITSLKWTFSNPMSGVCSQFFNHFTTSHDAVYVIRPKHYDKNKDYPLVVFCHGYLGNWRFYNGILKDLDNCIVLLIPTVDMSGIFSHDDIAKVFSRQIPFLEDQGYQIDKERIHLIGLSNGGSASDVAYRGFSNKLKSITYISCHPDQTYRIPSKVILIGGGKDGASNTDPALYRKMKANGNNVAMYWHEDDNHYTFAHNRKEIVQFLKEELEL